MNMKSKKEFNIKEVLKLLKKLDSLNDCEHLLKIYSDGAGRIVVNDKKIFSFRTELGLI